MKTFALTLTVLLAACGFTFAGPEPIASSGKEMKNVVPLPTPCPSWTGFEFGGFVGYKYGVVDTNVDLSGTWDSFRDAANVVEDHGTPDLSTSGAELGGLIAYNYQWHNWVFGAEAAGGYLWLRDSDSTEFFEPNFEDNYRTSTSFKTHYLFTFGGKIGYAMCRWLPYVTGGLAVGDLDYEQQILLQNDEGFRHAGSKSETNCGWFIGGGLEYMLTNHWRLRGQYQYIDLGSTSFNTEDSFSDGYISHNSVDLREHNAQFALIYGF